MKYGAMIVGILAGFYSLSYVGLFGSLFGGFMSWVDPTAASGLDGDTIRTLSVLLPIMAIAGGAICGANPQLGGVILLGSAAGHWAFLGFNSFSQVFICSAAIAGLLGLLSPRDTENAKHVSPSRSHPDASNAGYVRQDQSSTNSTHSAPVISLDQLRDIWHSVPIEAYTRSRIAAAVIDAVLIYGAISIVWPARSGSAVSDMFFYAFGAIVCFAYKSVMESSARRATIGKIIIGMIVETEDGSQITFETAAKRSWPAVIPFAGMFWDSMRVYDQFGDVFYPATGFRATTYLAIALGAGAFGMFVTNPLKQGLHDRWAKTRVAMKASGVPAAASLAETGTAEQQAGNDPAAETGAVLEPEQPSEEQG